MLCAVLALVLGRMPKGATGVGILHPCLDDPAQLLALVPHRPEFIRLAVMLYIRFPLASRTQETRYQGLCSPPRNSGASSPSRAS